MVSKNLFVCLSVCPSVTKYDPNYLRTVKTEWAVFFRPSMAKSHVSKKCFDLKVAGWARAEGQNSPILTQYLGCLA